MHGIISLKRAAKCEGESVTSMTRFLTDQW